MLRLQITNDTFIGLASKVDFEKILEVWTESCKKIGLLLSKQVVHEFNKRINNATVNNAKAKLDLSNSYLDHQKTVLLIETLAIKPVIAKLNLADNNITNETIKLLIRLLKGQSSLVRKIALDDRLSVVFLGDIILKKQSNFDTQLLLEIKLLTEILNIANLQAYIRNTFLEYYNQRSIIDVTMLTKIWTLIVVSKLDKNKLVQIFSTLNLKDKNIKNTFNYHELESIIIQGLIQKGSLSILTEKQTKLLAETTPIANTSPLNFNSIYGSTSPAYVNYVNSPPSFASPNKVTNTTITNNTITYTNNTSSSSNSSKNNVILNEAISNMQSNNNSSSRSSTPRRQSSIQEVIEIVAANTITRKYHEDNIVQVVIPDTDLLTPITSPQSIKTIFPTSYSSNNNSKSSDNNAMITSNNKSIISTEVPFTSSSIKNDSKTNTPSLLLSRQLSPSPSQRKSIKFNQSIDNMKPNNESMKSNQESKSPIKEEIHDIKLSTANKLIPTTAATTTTASHVNSSSVKSSQKPIIHEQIIYTNKNSNNNNNNTNSNNTDNNINSTATQEEVTTHNHVNVNAAIEQQYSITSSENYRNYVQKLEVDCIMSNDYVEEVIPPDSTFIQYDVTLNNRYHSIKHMNEIFKYCNAEKKSNLDFASILDTGTTPVLKILILRNDHISTIANLTLHGRFPYLTDLDLGYNNITGTIKSCPQTLIRLDLSYNKLSNVSAILLCSSLQELNLSHNSIKTFHGLPNRLKRLDISHNLIKTISTIRTLALSPSISSIAIHHNDITMQAGNEWKITLRSILLNLIEIDGKFLPNKRNITNNGVVNKINNKVTNNNKPIETIKKTSVPSKDQQQINDTIRTRQHQLNLLAKDETKLKNSNACKDLISKRTSLRPNEVNDLTNRLTSKTCLLSKQQQSLLSNQIAKEIKRDNISRILSKAIPKASLSYKQSSTIKSSKLHPSQSFSNNDVDLSSWITNSKQELRKAVSMIKKSFELAKQKDITSKDVMRYSHSLSLVSFYSSQDLPLKVEYAIEKLDINDPLFSKVSEVRKHIDKISTFLHQIESAILLSMKGAFQLTDSLDILMTSNAGLYKNINLLKLYGYTYDPSVNKTTSNCDNKYPDDVTKPELYSENKSYFDSFHEQYHISNENNSDKELFKDQQFDSSSVDDEYSYRVISPTTSPEQTLKTSNHSNNTNNNNKEFIYSNDDLLSIENTNLLMDRMRNRITLRTIHNSNTPIHDASKISFFENITNSNVKTDLLVQDDLNDNLELMLSKSIQYPDINSNNNVLSDQWSDTMLESLRTKKEEEQEKQTKIVFSNNNNVAENNLQDTLINPYTDNKLDTNISEINSDIIKKNNKIEPKLTAKERLQLRMQKSNTEVLLPNNNNKNIVNTTITNNDNNNNEITKVYEKSKSLQMTTSSVPATTSLLVRHSTPIKIINDIYYEVIFETSSLGFTLTKAYNDIPKVSKVNHDGPAYHAGIECNDSITKVGGILIKDYDEATNLILQSPRPLKIRFYRGSFSPNNETKVLSSVMNKEDNSIDMIENNNKPAEISNKLSHEKDNLVQNQIEQTSITRTVIKQNNEVLINKQKNNSSSVPESYLQGINEIESPNNVIHKASSILNTKNNDTNEEKGYDLLSSLVESNHNSYDNTTSINNDHIETIDNIVTTDMILVQDNLLNDKLTAKDRLLARMAKNKN